MAEGTISTGERDDGWILLRKLETGIRDVTLSVDRLILGTRERTRERLLANDKVELSMGVET